MEFYRQLLPLNTKQLQKQKVIKDLLKSYPSVIADSRNKVLAGFGKFRNLDFSKRDVGELFRTPDGMLFYVMMPEKNSYIELGYFADTDSAAEAEKTALQIRHTITDSLALDDDAPWKNYKTPNVRFNQLKDTSVSLIPTKDDATLVKELQNHILRKILQEIASETNCFLENLVKKFEDEDVFSVIEKLIDMGLITREYFVFCRETKRQISRMLDIDFIRDSSSHGLRCPYCAKPFSEEKVDQGLTLTERGQRFSRVNIWLALYVLILLQSKDIKPADILLKAENKSENIELFVNYCEQLIYIGLKEKEVRLDDIYMFSERAKIYNPDTTLIICSRKLSDEASRYLHSSKEPIRIIDSIDAVEKELSDILKQIRNEYINKSLVPFSGITEVPLEDIILSYFLKEKADLISHTIREQARFGKEKTYVQRIQELMGSDYVPEQLVKPEEEISPELLENGSQEAAQTPLYEEQEELFAEDPFDFPVQEEPAAAETETEDGGETEPAPALEEQPADELPETASADEDEYIVLEEDDGENYILEETIQLEFGPQESISIPEFSAEEIEKDEKRRKISAQIVDFISANGVAGKSAELDGIFGEFRSVANMAGCLAGSDGLLILSSSDDRDAGEKTAAYGSYLHDTLQKMLKSKVSVNVMFASFDTDDYFVRAIQDYRLITKDTDQSRSQEEQAAMSPGSAGLRDSIAGKIFEELAGIGSINGCQLLSEEGTVLINTMDSVKMPVIENLINFWKENKEYAGKLNSSKLKQLCVFTDDQLYSLIPFADGSMFICAADINTPREIWNLKIQESAGMLA